MATVLSATRLKERNCVFSQMKTELFVNEQTKKSICTFLFNLLPVGPIERLHMEEPSCVVTELLTRARPLGLHSRTEVKWNCAVHPV